LREQRSRGIGYFDNQEPIRRGVFCQAPHMFGQQRIKMARHPLRRFPLEALGSVFQRDYLRACVQES
jgi:hypothetical protein